MIRSWADEVLHTGEGGHHAHDVGVEVLDLVVVADPGRGDLGEDAGTLDAVFQGRLPGAQQLADHCQSATLEKEIDNLVKLNTKA